MAKFNFEDYRQPWETGPHWELKKEFMDKYQDNFPEDRLLCLAQAYANIVLMNCSYPDPVMRQIHELSKPLKGCKQFQKMENANSGSQQQERGKWKPSDGACDRGLKLIKFCSAANSVSKPQEYHIKNEKSSTENTSFNSSLKRPASVNACRVESEQRSDENSDFDSSSRHSKIDLRLFECIAKEIKEQIVTKEIPYDVILHAVEILGLKELSRFTLKEEKTGFETLYSCDFFIGDFKVSSEVDVTASKAKSKAAQSGVDFFMNPSNFNLKLFTNIKNEGGISEDERQQTDATSKRIKLEKTDPPVKRNDSESANNIVCVDMKSSTVENNHLNLIQNYVQEIRNLLTKKVLASSAIHDAAQRLNISDKINFQITLDPKSPRHAPTFHACFFIENHLIASAKGRSKKIAKTNTIESAINVMLNSSDLTSVLCNVCQECKEKTSRPTAVEHLQVSSIVNDSTETEPDLSTNSEQHRVSLESNLSLHEKLNVIPRIKNKFENMKKKKYEKESRFAHMDDQTLIKILAERLKKYKGKNKSAYDRILLAVKATRMMNLIQFKTTTNSNNSKESLTFCCEFFVRNTLVACGEDQQVKKAMHKACENAVSVLSDQCNMFNAHKTSLCETGISVYDVIYSKVEKKLSPVLINKQLFDSSVQRKFVLIDNSEYKLRCEMTPASVLAASASFSRKAFTYNYEAMTSTTQQNIIRAEISFDGQIVGCGMGSSKQEAKTEAALYTLEKLKKLVYTIKVKNQHVSGYTVEPEQLRNAPTVSDVLAEDNIGCKMMKMMGWTGGGIGKSSGITEPIVASDHRSGQGLGYVDKKKSNTKPEMREFHLKITALLKDYSMSNTTNDLIFSSNFTKEERAEIHKIAAKFGVQTVSYGKGSDRYMTVKRRFQVVELLYLLLQSGGSTDKYELVDRSS